LKNIKFTDLFSDKKVEEKVPDQDKSVTPSIKPEHAEQDEEFISVSILDSFKDSLESNEDNKNGKIIDKLDLVHKKPKKYKSKKKKQNLYISFENDKPIIDRWSLSEGDVNELVSEYESQKKRFLSRNKKLRDEFSDWQKGHQKNLNGQKGELLKKQDLIRNLEKKNKKLELELNSKLEEYEKLNKQLNHEKKRLTKREIDIAKKSEKFNDKRKEFESKLKEIESDSLRLDAHRERLLRTQQEFAEQVNEFEKVIRNDKSGQLKKDIENSQAELSSEWLKLHEEEKRLEKVREELIQTKDEFMDKFTSEREELESERELLNEEWEKIKKVRKNLKFAMPTLESKLKKLLTVEEKSKLKIFKKSNIKDFERRISELEDRLFEEISKEISKVGESSKDILAKEWAKLHSEEKKLKDIYEEVLSVKNKIQDRFETQREELKQERNTLAQEWKKLEKFQKKYYLDNKNKVLKRKKQLETIQPFGTKSKKELKKQKSSEGYVAFELDSKLKALHAELKAERTELKTQKEKLTKALEEFSKTKSIFEKGKKGLKTK
jgi:chromosome segregation ATPase